MNTNDKEDSITLGILESIEQQEHITQRHLAAHLGVALGLANSYLRRCVRKGYVKIKQAPANRYLYYLTPKGFAEKSRLTVKFFSASFEFYRKASDAYLRILQECTDLNQRSLIFLGISELGEIATLRSQDMDIEIVAVFEPNTTKTEFLSIPVFKKVGELPECDAYILTTLNASALVLDKIKKNSSESTVYIPYFLNRIESG